MRRLIAFAGVGLFALAIAAQAQSPATKALPGDASQPPDVQVSVDIRLISLPTAAEEKILGGTDFNSKNAVAFLDDAQRQSLYLAALASDKQFDLVQVQRITVSSGQRGSVQLTDYQFFLTGVSMNSANGQMFFSPDNKPYELGFRSTVCPTASADRRFVSLDLHVSRKTLATPEVPLIPVQIPVPQAAEGPPNATTPSQPVVFQMFFQQPQFAVMEVKQKLNIATGKTALIIAGKESRQVRGDLTPRFVPKVAGSGDSPPVLSKIPYLSRLFKNTAYGQEPCTTILLVTPRIVSDSETREVFLNNSAPRGN